MPPAGNPPPTAPASSTPTARGNLALVVATASVTLAVGVTLAALGGYLRPRPLAPPPEAALPASPASSASPELPAPEDPAATPPDPPPPEEEDAAPEPRLAFLDRDHRDHDRDDADDDDDDDRRRSDHRTHERERHHDR